MLERLVAFCVRWSWPVVALTLALSGAAAYLTATRFAIDTDTSNLFASSLAWRKNEAELYKNFPQLDDLIVAVIDARSPELAEDAAKRLTDSLRGAPLVQRVWRPDDNDFFRANGLLYLSAGEIKRLLGAAVNAHGILQPLVADPSLRGLTSVLLGQMKLIGASARGQAMIDRGLDEFSSTFEAVLAGKPAEASWDKLLAAGAGRREEARADGAEISADAGAPEPRASAELRKLVLIRPIQDYSALQPAADAIDLVRRSAADLALDDEHGVRLRLTGQAPLADDEFATVSENMERNLAITLGVVTLILFAALRSPKLIVAVFSTLLAGLALTAGLGILLIGRFNMISVAFAALFIGLGVDFGIQFATRYREERHKSDSQRNGLDEALTAAARGIGGSLTLAAVSLVAGFFCFLPTDFRGVSELGLIAGCGMIIAFLTTLTFLPAAIKLLKPRPERLPLEAASLATVDHWIAGHRSLVIVGAVAATLAGAPFLLHMSFDSNPMNLRNQQVESVQTFLDLCKDPKTAPNTIDILAPSLPEARTLAARLAALPQVDHVVTIDAVIPRDQDEKIPLIEDAKLQLREVLEPKMIAAPADTEEKTALFGAIKTLRGGAGKSPRPAVARFANALERLAKADASMRAAARAAAFNDLTRMIGELRGALRAERIAPETLPEDIASDWVSPSGKYRVETSPKGDGNDREVLTAFAGAVQQVAPDASGPPIVIAEAGATVVRAFGLAGLYAFIAIFAILAIALRNAKDVALTLGPLLLAGVMSLEYADFVGMPLNFANIIALPLMFAVGVAFHIYYVIAWRKGVADMLASSLTRAIFFSALTTGTAFGSLFFSSHPGTASMGALLAISLVFTLLAAFFVVPAFLGPPPTQGRRA